MENTTQIRVWLHGTLSEKIVVDQICRSSGSYMVYSSYQIWFLSLLKFFFQLFVFPYSLLVEVYYAFFHCSFRGTSLIVFAFPC